MLKIDVCNYDEDEIKKQLNITQDMTEEDEPGRLPFAKKNFQYNSEINGWKQESDSLSSKANPKPKKSAKVLSKYLAQEPESRTQSAYPETLKISDGRNQTATDLKQPSIES